ncbi:MAG: ACT domain-containing protein [Clostridium sp.]|uniref:ACT domain-containing protein n=1 Tax=Clostridium sp. DSM 8431 TaxID=1761781 RepID=UPI0008E86B1E|nr:ACT domain-containing protein [Clostridium sp. DSM 8431]MCR4944594.1 ACT domain-containing protein [Clostridium sp.]SFU68477.1 ACT domain-containing protein [Clostridium sp. DSM 8431]
MKSILTVIGQDQVGIIAGVSKKLSEFNINILNVTQTIMDGYFTMIMMLDLKEAEKSFEEIKKGLAETGKELKVDVKIQREEIFNSMHSL